MTPGANDIVCTTAASENYGYTRMDSNGASGRSFSIPPYASASELLPTSATYSSILSAAFTNPSGMRLVYTGSTRNFLITYSYGVDVAEACLIQLAKGGALITGTDIYSVPGTPAICEGRTIQSIASGDVITIYCAKVTWNSKPFYNIQLSMIAL